jgi:hypothetical protein
MATSHSQQFRHDASPAPDTEGPLGLHSLDGPRTSWCLHQGRTPRPGAAFGAGIRRCRVNLHKGRLGMTGRAAADHILASYPYSG